MFVIDWIQFFLSMFGEFASGAVFLLALSGAYVIVRTSIKLISGSNLFTQKKSYDDEMSHYDSKQILELPNLPYNSGVSLEDLPDGEIPDNAFLRD